MSKETFAFDPFQSIGEQWALVSAGTAEKSNTMTVSWGGVGVLWGKNVVYIFIRRSRYTKEFIDAGDTFSLAFPGEEYKKAMGFCGSQTGRGIDKWKQAGLTPAEKDGVVYPAEAKTVFLCRKLAAVPVDESSFIDPQIMPDWYADNDMHTMYVGEIIDIIR